jgi:hypothetical protein
VLFALAAVVFGTAVSVALAGHYHTAGGCGAPNGLVHGSNTDDANYHGRVEKGECGSYQKTCEIFNSRSALHLSAESYYATCNVWTDNPGGPECGGYARVYYATVFDRHYHNAHNWCG